MGIVTGRNPETDYVAYVTTILLEPAFTEFERIEQHDPGAIIFAEGDLPLGIFALRSGSVEMHFRTPRGGITHPRTAQPGQLLGLSAVVMQHRYEFSAIARTECETGFIERDRYERLLAEDPHLLANVLRILSGEVNAAYRDLRLLSLSR